MVQPPITNATTIADEFLKLAKRRGRTLTPMQLMKLVYIAHGWSLAILERDLFGDRIEAWKYGPVIPGLYQATKRFGRNPIPLDLIEEEAQSCLDKPVSSFLDDVFEKYGHLTGIHLSNLTHQPCSPWDMVFEDGMNIEIPDHIIRDHYVSKLNEQNNSSSAA